MLKKQLLLTVMLQEIAWFLFLLSLTLLIKIALDVKNLTVRKEIEDSCL